MREMNENFDADTGVSVEFDSLILLVNALELVQKLTLSYKNNDFGFTYENSYDAILEFLSIPNEEDALQLMEFHISKMAEYQHSFL